MSINIYPADHLHFLPFAEQFSGNNVPTPLRRAFSLMRQHGCHTVVCESREWEKSCSSEECGTRFLSCKNYTEKIPHFKCSLIKKTCWRISFFNKHFTDKRNLQSLSDDCLMGFCIVHKDDLKRNKQQWTNSYVTESHFLDPFKDRGMTFGSFPTQILIAGKQFQIRKKYFSQQNSLTNCCAHAAIKMAIRSYCPDITSEKINEVLGIDNRERKGGKGLFTHEIRSAIESLSGLKTHSMYSDNFDSPLDFLKAVYFSLESRMPVILLFKLPGENRDSEFSGHAVAVIGHTFNEHNWWPHSQKEYFTPREENIKYFPSLLWCDNFIIQDDNFGQYYLMPVRFLTDYAGLSGILTAIEKSAASLMPMTSKEAWLEKPVSAIFIYPPEKELIRDSFSLEPWALMTLNRLIDFITTNKALPKSMIFKKYFLNYQKSGDLILRTFMISRDEYLESEGVEILPSLIKKKLQKKLPDNFCITEISIPELFWINKSKIGEIITNANVFKHSRKNAVKFIRLPNIVSFLNRDNVSLIHIPQGENQPYQKLITAKGLLTPNSPM